MSFTVFSRASAEEMRTAALAAERPPAPKSNTLHSNLVAHAQPISFTGAPVFDSNV